MLGTSPDARGGIASVVQAYRASGLLDKWHVRYLTTHVQKSGLAKFGIALSAFRQLLWLLLSDRVSLLHVHMSSRASTWRKSVYLLVGMAFGVPCLIHIHGGNYVEFFQRECGQLQRRFIRWLFNRATNVIVLSPSWSADIQNIAATARTVVLYNSVALPVLSTALIQRDSAASFSIIFLGRITAPKGAFDLIRAAALVRGNFKLTLCGNGELASAMALVKELGLGAKVDFAGWVAGVEKEELLARAQLFVLPSHYEGVPIAILEAMSWALPVVSTSVGGIPEVVTNGVEGLLVAPADIHGLAEALNRLLSDSTRCREMGSAGRSRIEHEYSQAVLHPQLEQLWKNAGASVP